MKKILLLLTFLISVYSIGYAQCTNTITGGFIGADQTICYNSFPATITQVVSPTNVVGTPTYTWERSFASTGPFTTIAGATNANLSATLPFIQDTYIRRIIIDPGTAAPCNTATSNVVHITVLPQLTPGIIAADQTICSGGDPVVLTPTIPAKGGSGVYTYKWQTSSVGGSGPWTDISTAATNAAYDAPPGLTATTYYRRVDASGTCPSANTNVITITIAAPLIPGTVTADQTICYNTAPVSFTSTAAATGGNGTYVYQWQQSTISSSVYVDIAGATNATYTEISLLTADSYYRRKVISGSLSPCNVAYSNVIHITVLPQLIGGVISTDQTLCAGSTPALLTSIVSPAGGTGTYTYQWQSNASGSFQNIPGATNSSYASPALVATTQFQRVETSGTCGTVTSNIVTKTVTAPEVITVSINDPGQICSGSLLFPFIATASTTGTGTLSYQWFLGTTPVGINSPNYTYNPVVGDDNKIVKVVVTTSNGCNAGPAVSNIVTLDIVPATTPTVTITTSNNPQCIGLQTTFTATSTGAGTVPAYQWYIIPQGLGSSVAVSTGSTTFSSSTLHDGDRVYVELTSSLACLVGTNPYNSNEIIMNIKPIPSPIINEGDQSICSPNSFTFHGIVTAGNSYEWRQLPTNTVVSTGSAFTSTQSGSYYIYEDNGTCNASSQPVTLTVIPVPQANAGPDQYVLASSNVILNASGGNKYSWTPSTYLSNATIANPSLTADQTITYTVTISDPSGTCSTTDDVTIYVTTVTPGTFSTSITGPNPIMPGQQNARYGVPNQTGFTYTWSVTGGTIVNGQNTNAVTVDWDAPVSNAFARTTATSYSISVLEKNTSNQTKTTTATINTISTAVVQSQAQAGINVFPNPTTGSFNIEMPESGIDVAYEILDVTGRSVGSGAFTSTGNDQQINADFGAGMYQVVLKYNNVVACIRLSKVQ